MSTSLSSLPLLEALLFAARKHRDQRRKGAEASPYINHPIEVAHILAAEGVDDPHVLQAAILHDVLEDTETTREELDGLFGVDVRTMVEELTDDKSLPKAERKRLQVEHAPHRSQGARMIKMGDKIANVRSMIDHPPLNWPMERRLEYLDWTEMVIAGCRSANSRLAGVYDRTLADARAASKSWE